MRPMTAMTICGADDVALSDRLVAPPIHGAAQICGDVRGPGAV